MSESNPDRPQEEPKIIVDEDWKEQVKAEKDAAQMDTAGDQSGATGDANRIPEASFPMLVTTLATQATVALGQMASPDATEVPVDLDLAKHLVDTLAILEQKTQGNLTPEESGMLTNVLHQLRMLFVAVQGQLEQTPDKKSSIELP